MAAVALFLRFHNWPHRTSRLTVGSVGADSDGLNLRPRPLLLLLVFCHSLATVPLTTRLRRRTALPRPMLGLSSSSHSRHSRLAVLE
jgi:hypothetical protein